MESAGSSLLISVILPVRNEENHLAGVLDGLAAQDFPGEEFEVLVIDGSSDDNTREIAEKYRSEFPHFQLLDNQRKLASTARNIGFMASTGKYILFIDGHCQIVSKSMLGDIVDLFQKHDVLALCRPQPLTAAPMTWFQQGVALARSSAFGHGLDSTIYHETETVVPASSAGAVYRREVFDKIGGFDENFDACEDVEFNTRFDFAGLKALISPRLTVRYAARTSPLRLFKQLFRYGLGRWRLLRRHPRTFSWGLLAPPLFVVALLSLPLWWLVAPFIGLLLSLVLTLYILLSFTFSLTIALKHRVSLFFLLPLIFFTIHLALGIGVLAGPFRRSRAGQ